MEVSTFLPALPKAPGDLAGSASYGRPSRLCRPRRPIIWPFAVLAQVALLFEVRVARDYSRRGGIPWRPVEYSGGAPAAPLRPEVFCSGKFAGLAGRRGRAPGRLRGRGVPPGPYVLPAPLWRPLGTNPETVRFLVRRHLLARRLRQHLSQVPPGEHLGGWEHLVNWQWRRLVAGPGGPLSHCACFWTKLMAD